MTETKPSLFEIAEKQVEDEKKVKSQAVLPQSSQTTSSISQEEPPLIDNSEIQKPIIKRRKKPMKELTLREKMNKKHKRLSTALGATALSSLGIAVAAQILKGRQEAQQEMENLRENPPLIGGGAGKEPVQITQNNYANFDFAQIGNIGLERSGIHLKDLSNPKALISKPFLRLAAKFGDDFLLPPVVDKEGRIVLEVSEAVVANWVEAFKLNSEEETDFRQNYVFYGTHPKEFGQFMLQHGASPTVVDFLAKTEELKTQDTDPATWLSNDPNNPDRYETLQQWLMRNNIIISKIERKVEKNIVVRERDFQEVAGLVCRDLGVNYEEIGGPLETLSCMPIDTTAMHEMVAVDVAEFWKPELEKPLLANTGLSLILTGLLLLRVGPSWPKAVIAKASKRLEDVYYWVKLGQPERAVRDLMVLGKQAWEKVVGKKD